jgi:hypothetical protein
MSKFSLLAGGAEERIFVEVIFKNMSWNESRKTPRTTRNRKFNGPPALILNIK